MLVFPGEKLSYYKDAEKILSIVSRLIFTSFFGIVAVTIVSSGAETIREVLFNGKELEENFFIPIVAKMPFKINTWLRYAIALTWSSANYLVTVGFKIITLTIQNGLCFYSIAVLRHLRSSVGRFQEVG